jgi:thiamine-monophosphate kinase
MIDLSDGLAGDLRHLLKSSHVGAELLKSAIPISRAAKEISRSRACQSADDPPTHVGGYKSAFVAALADGEDFELLFTVASGDAVKLLDAWKKQFPKLRLRCIGKITADEGITIRNKSGAQPLTAHGYAHFIQSGRD